MTRTLTWVMVFAIAVSPWVAPPMLVAAGMVADRAQAWVVVSSAICAVFADAWACPRAARS